jgi:orotidine-5'-phosphate decarboxylase
MKKLTPGQRLIVAADFKPDPLFNHARATKWVEEAVLGLAQQLKGTGICLKVNSALRLLGYQLINEIKQYDLDVFADLKLCDIGETLSTDGMLLNLFQPTILTVMCATGEIPMKALKATLPNTEVLGITVLTSMNDEEARMTFHCTSLAANVSMFAYKASQANMDGIVCAATDIASVKSSLASYMSINTPAIRPTWAIVPGDDQNIDRIMTPYKAIRAGAHRIVVGRPITQAKNPFDAAMRTIEEIQNALQQKH